MFLKETFEQLHQQPQGEQQPQAKGGEETTTEVVDESTREDDPVTEELLTAMSEDGSEESETAIKCGCRRRSHPSRPRTAS